MSQLYALCRAVGDQLEATHPNDPMGLLRAKGALATKAGFLVTMVSPGDIDDPEKLARLRRAARELGIDV